MSPPRHDSIANHWPYVRELADRLSLAKRLTDAELAAEVHSFSIWYIKTAPIWQPNFEHNRTGQIIETLHRFAIHPHYDEE